MQNLTDLDHQIEATQVELQAALARLKSFTTLQTTLESADAGIREGGEALSKLSEHLALTTQSLTEALGAFSDAIDAMRKATPEALSRNVDVAMAAAERTERSAAEFQAQLKEEIAEQREALERRVHAVEAGLEQTRGNIAQLRHLIEERDDESARRTRRFGRWTLAMVTLTLVLVVLSAAAGLFPHWFALPA